jgi:hypothetical protein
MDRRLGRALPWVLLLIFLVRGCLAIGADGTTVDEPLHLSYGERALTAHTFVRDQALLNSKMPVSVLNAIPVVLASRGHDLGWHEKLLLARWPSLLLAALLGWLVWRWAASLFGAASGALALLLYTFCPNVIAHGHLVTTDLSTALGIFAATYCLWRYLAAPSTARLLVAAGVFGAAQLTKATALFLVVIFVLLLAAHTVHELKAPSRPDEDGSQPGVRLLGRRAIQGALLLFVFGVAAILALNLGFWFEGTGTPLARYAFVSPAFQSLATAPVLRDVPVPLPYAYLQGLDMVARDAQVDQWTYLRGRYSLTGFRSYFLWSFLVKVPLATQALLAIALGLWISGRARAPGADSFLVLPVLVLLVYLSCFFQLDIGFRYFLPALPFLFVFASRVASPWTSTAAAPTSGECRDWRQSEPRPGARRTWISLLAALILWLGASSLGVHPHYLAYFNEIAGGPAKGSSWLIDSNLDWGQDSGAVRGAYAASSPVPLLFDPSGPVAGRIAVGVTDLVGRYPGAATRHAWLREHFTPIATIGYSWKIFEVTEADIARCCADLPSAWLVDRLADDLALKGEPFAGGEGVTVRFQERLNDGMLGANDAVDAARSVPPMLRPVRAWFGVSWPAPQTIGRVVAFPGFLSRGPLARKFLALDYVFQSWDGGAWRDLPGTRVIANRALRVEHRFPPVETTRIRLVVERERNEWGKVDEAGGYRAACLELAAYRE